MANRAYVNQIVQVGTEVTPGAGGSTNRLIEAFTWSFGAKPTTKQFTATGRKNPSSSELLAELSQGKISGQADYQALIYPLASAYGKTAPTAHGPSTTAYDWTFTPPIAGAANPQTYVAQIGDGTNTETYAYLLFHGWGYSFSRQTEVTVSGDWFSQAFSTVPTLTASPTAISQVPMTGAQFAIALDPTSTALGTTDLSAHILKADFAASNYYGQFWPLNRASSSYSSHIDLLPKNELKLTLEADSTALALIATYLRTGARAYIRVSGQGPVADSANNVNFAMTHDLCCFLTGVGDFSDVDGAYAYELTFSVAEDLSWSGGRAQQITLTNLLATL